MWLLLQKFEAFSESHGIKPPKYHLLTTSFCSHRFKNTRKSRPSSPKEASRFFENRSSALFCLYTFMKRTCKCWLTDGFFDNLSANQEQQFLSSLANGSIENLVEFLAPSLRPLPPPPPPSLCSFDTSPGFRESITFQRSTKIHQTACYASCAPSLKPASHKLLSTENWKIWEKVSEIWQSVMF